jgi:hypothetical protein
MQSHIDRALINISSNLFNVLQRRLVRKCVVPKQRCPLRTENGTGRALRQ